MIMLKCFVFVGDLYPQLFTFCISFFTETTNNADAEGL